MGATIAIAVYLVLLCATVYGWAMNLVTLVMWTGDFTAEFWVRIVGVPVFVVGVIMGWLF